MILTLTIQRYVYKSDNIFLKKLSNIIAIVKLVICCDIAQLFVYVNTALALKNALD